jgi:mannose-6-phosphate isomerase-like protein (cupin superfamily)
MDVIEGAARFAAPADGASTHWVEHLRVADLSVGTYSIRRGGTDGQSPHTEDEIYVVTAGQAAFEAGGRRVPVGPGSVLYVPAGEPHKFTDVTEDLAVVVVFAPAEDTRK